MVVWIELSGSFTPGCLNLLRKQNAVSPFLYLMILALMVSATRMWVLSLEIARPLAKARSVASSWITKVSGSYDSNLEKEQSNWSVSNLMTNEQ